MNQNNPLQNNTTGFNNYPQPSTNMIQMEQSDYSDYLFTTDDNVISDSYITSNYGQQQFEQSERSAFSLDSTSTTQSLYYTPNQEISSLNTNSSQANNSEIFRFEIPGFKIIIIPTNLDAKPISTRLYL